MTKPDDGEQERAGTPDLRSPVPETLVADFRQLGLAPYEARVLLALLRAGSATTTQLAQLSGVHRTSTYKVVEELASKGLAERLPAEGLAAVWASPGRDVVFARLDEVEQDRLSQHRALAGQVRETLEAAFPEVPSVALPFVHLLQSTPQVQAAYAQVLGGATEELLMFTRGPFATPPGQVNPAVMAALERGVHARVVYQAHEVDPTAEDYHFEFETYHEAGVEGRLVDELPMKLVVVDSKVALVAMTDPDQVRYPTTVLIEHPGYAAVHGETFERRWAEARPYVPPERAEAETETQAGAETAAAG